ncbi:cobalamin-binding protein [Undibacterium sp. FT137W]|uniref:Cobalamin-binding protein n=2 Tax=Undibacterium fentianense TaxID=2828728 RepID=A0A941E4P7_9BURK|nr:cobalamin-binding protein [Undibacterium fentianense]
MVASFCNAADIRVIDDGQRSVVLPQPAKRIISLAPHVTEMVFAAGAGDYLVGVSEYSDFPEQAKKITSVGNIFALDLERLLSLKPDLVIIWGTGNAKHLAKKLRENKITVFESEPHNFEDIATSFERIATLSGTTQTGNAAAQQFRQRLEKLRTTYQLASGEKPVSVFHQMVKSPLMTINKEHFISKMIQLCGGENVFKDLKEISSTITMEALLASNPELIFSSGKDQTKILKDWENYPTLQAVKKQNLYAIPGDWLHRAGPRILDATEMLCKDIQQARKTR